MKNINKNKTFRLLLTALVGVWYTPGAHAAYEDVGVGARVTGMGNAFTALADDVYAVYYNPAGLGMLDRPQLATTYSRLLTGLSDNSNLQNSFIAFERPLQFGRQGTYGAAWNYFTLDGLYSEMSFSGAYGRRILAEKAPHGLYAGATLKWLRRSLGDTDAADNAFSDTGARRGVPDPVLKRGARTNLDLDLGVLYRPAPRIALGLALQHLFEPNVAFDSADTDKLGRGIKLGAAYQTSWTSFAGDLHLTKAPDGSTDKIATVAVEKWLPTLMYGTFGMRGGVGLGSRDFRQLTTGLSYRIHRMQVDYSFGIPLGTVSSTFGTHRLGMSFKFGRPQAAEPQFAEAILENMRELAEIGTPEFRAQAEELALYKRTAQREFLRQAQVDAGEGRFAEAQAKVYQALSLNEKDKGLQDSNERLALVAKTFPEVSGFRTDAAQAALYEGVMDYLAGKEKDAVRKLAYAQSLDPGDARIEELLQAVERKAGLAREIPVEPAVTAPTAEKEKLVAASMALMEVALREQDWEKVLKLAREVLELDPANALAHKRMATAQYAKKDYTAALRSLNAALKFERQPETRKRLKAYIDALAGLIKRVADTKPPVVKPEVKKPEPGKVSPYEIQRMYEAGVDLYVQGRLSEAARLFEQILELDPKNSRAELALRRVQAIILRGQE